MRTLLALLAFVAFHAHAQGVLLPGQTVPIALQVQRLAPQLVAFAGSQGSFENLVNGLALGAPVTLTTVGADGVTQTVIFTAPGGPVTSPPDIARALEAARQQLIATGVATPTAQQLGEVVSGSPVPVSVGTLPVQPAGAAAAGGTVPSPAQQIQSRNAPAAPQVNTSDSRAVGNTSDTPVPAPSAAVPPPPTTAPPVTRAPALPPSPRP